MHYTRSYMAYACAGPLVLRQGERVYYFHMDIWNRKPRRPEERKCRCDVYFRKEQLETEVARQEPRPWGRWRGPAARVEAREDRGESIRMERNRVGSYPESAAGMPPWTTGRPPPCIRLGGQGRSWSRGGSMRRGWHAALPIHGVACAHLPASEPERQPSTPWDLGWRLEGNIRRRDGDQKVHMREEHNKELLIGKQRRT
ncbi:uncharacterized protein [Triticum aestivum]|uniref:uncharacterized protein n=1 Tax=Triticum aestivum TaxID=4565 RepID=UPI001D035932|nr:uncharacterized protein LOC123063187 [Triticum aestivum]